MMQIRQLTRSFATATTTTTSNIPIKSSLILSRTPIVTQDISEFEKLFYNYQEELERRLMWTFPKWFYFKKGTVAEREFSEAQNYPIPNARGVWFPQGNPDLKHGRDRRFKQEVILPKKHIESDNNNKEEDSDNDFDNVGRPIRANSRITKFDKENDQTSLERKLPRTLYLLVNQNGNWKFPSFNVLSENENSGLHKIAEDGLRIIGGDKINTWSVSNSPAAVIKYDSNNKIIHNTDNNDQLITREFLIKSHIIAGKFDLQKSNNSVSDFKWLVKEEIKDLVDISYYSKIDHLLSDI
ncbi:54S ribosomal protein L17 mitochondrial [Pichia californica]|uniref:Large ribosomal subunit protein mL46 n=1 Tax=Pichia californica TaxID=460514 RepID=A0A9P7BIJ1_9ASCO|nr:54S ribosomal protein L17 mitochondrial [[Candida] californica]KAG0691218.1 54S ribosomal protein L17 mitochondrial [[Candida] californica]